MSRLVPSDIRHIASEMALCEAQWRQKTGAGLLEIACHALEMPIPTHHPKTAVVPITSGLGTIDTFADSVCGILDFVGARAFVTQRTDIAGIQEAYQQGVELIFCADDDVYLGMATCKTVQSDNGYATGIGFAAALDLAAPCAGQRVLVLGAGPVGCAGAAWLMGHGAKVQVYDPIPGKAAKGCPGAEILTQPPVLSEYDRILDATPVGDWVTASQLRPDVVYSTPGMPLSIVAADVDRVWPLHDPLELGTAVMYCDCLRQMEG